MQNMRNRTREVVKQISADECVMKNRAGTTTKLKKHRPPHISKRRKDEIKVDKTSTLINHSHLHILQQVCGAMQHK